jgi:hypothetical protein
VREMCFLMTFIVPSGLRFRKIRDRPLALALPHRPSYDFPSSFP